MPDRHGRWHRPDWADDHDAYQRDHVAVPVFILLCVAVIAACWLWR